MAACLVVMQLVWLALVERAPVRQRVAHVPQPLRLSVYMRGVLPLVIVAVGQKCVLPVLQSRLFFHRPELRWAIRRQKYL